MNNAGVRAQKANWKDRLKLGMAIFMLVITLGIAGLTIYSWAIFGNSPFHN